MTAVMALTEVLTRGGRVVWGGPRPRLLVPRDLKDRVLGDRATVREILRRASHFREQAVRFIRDGQVLPMLSLPDRTGRQGCLSCGAAIGPGQFRCDLCALAVALALGEKP
ncbi:MAG: hypothetical protein ACHQ7N_19660 [Candidatus Methylomirabilales bacterium]